MAISTIIFDFDGTVVDTNQVVINSWQHTYMTIDGKERPVEEIVKSFGEPLIISMEKAFPGHEMDKLLKIYRGYQANHFNEMIELFPGMDQLMSDLKKKGYNVGIVTSRTHDTTLNGLDAFGLSKYVDHIVSCDDTTKHKPDPEPALLSLKYFGAKPEEALMIGDSMFDIKCAHNAGIQAVLVDWAIAVTEEDKLGPDKPEYIIKKPEELFEIC